MNEVTVNLGQESVIDIRITATNKKASSEFKIYFPDDEDDQPTIEGYIKWDGCSNWQVGKHVMFHACNREELLNLGKILAACHDWTKQNNPNISKTYFE